MEERSQYCCFFRVFWEWMERVGVGWRGWRMDTKRLRVMVAFWIIVVYIDILIWEFIGIYL